MPTFLNDTFTDTNAVALGSHTGETGATWAKVTGFAGVHTINTNRIYCSSGNALYYASGIPASANYDVTAAVRVVTNGVNAQVGIIGRSATGSADNYVLYLERVTTGGGTWSCVLYDWARGQLGVFGITTPTAGSDHTLTLRMVGNQISALYDSVVVLGPITSSTITAAGRAGVFASATVTTSTGVHIDSITAATAAAPAAPEYNYPQLAVHRASTY